ncbi:hypothetical protein L6452_32863 [Arctium lappa]|uniref:Uncharacterized protein n=1 Tax=Arctium lappa TaxID=4217 RepID=A0ACB8Z5P5_ARCLA|nr:hypothetical protein L6452_32863 [Arctium lappa]
MALNTTPLVTELNHDRQAELKAFDETKVGVKGLVDAGITEVPRIFRVPSPEIIISGQQLCPEKSLPTIDLEGINVDQIRRKEVVEKVNDASERWGFFQIVNHGIPSSVLEEMIEGVRRFHEQDTEVKKKWYNMNFRGKPPVVFNSNFDLYVSRVANWRDSLICNMAPDPPSHHEMPPICREILMKYSDEVHKLSVRILELFSEALGLNPSHLVEMGHAEGLSVLGHYYPPCPQPELTIGTNNHTDNTLFTILLQDHIGGLQVFNENQWIDVSPIPGALIVNVGEHLKLLTNGKFECASHRVLSKKVGPRISVASFLKVPSAQSSKVVEPIKELLSEENPAKYRSTTVEEFTKYFQAKGLNGVSTTLHYQI